MSNYLFHNAANPSGFMASGTAEESQLYLSRLNKARAINPWSVRNAGGTRPRGIPLAKLIADHDAAHATALRATRATFAHGHEEQQ